MTEMLGSPIIRDHRDDNLAIMTKWIATGQLLPAPALTEQLLSLSPVVANPQATQLTIADATMGQPHTEEEAKPNDKPDAAEPTEEAHPPENRPPPNPILKPIPLSEAFREIKRQIAEKLHNGEDAAHLIKHTREMLEQFKKYKAEHEQTTQREIAKMQEYIDGLTQEETKIIALVDNSTFVLGPPPHRGGNRGHPAGERKALHRQSE